MNISSARIKRAKATGYFVLLRNLIFLILSAVAFFIKRNVISLVYFIIGGCIDLYLLFSIFIIIKLFEGLNHVSYQILYNNCIKTFIIHEKKNNDIKNKLRIVAQLYRSFYYIKIK